MLTDKFDYKGVLFDLDGTLIDSMQKHAMAWERALQLYGVIFDRDEYFRLEGTSVIELAQKYLGPGNIRRSEELLNKKEEEFKNIIAESPLEIYEGVQELLTYLKAHEIKCGIVTAGSRSRVLSTLDDGVLSHLDCLVCGDDGLPGKPSPEPYLAGRRKLDLQGRMESVLAVENAPLGVESALNAGCRVSVILSSCTALDFSHSTNVQCFVNFLDFSKTLIGSNDD